MKKKFKIIDASTGEKYKLKEWEMLVMNDQGMRGIRPILVGNFLDYGTYVRKLSDVCKPSLEGKPRFNVIWMGEE